MRSNRPGVCIGVGLVTTGVAAIAVNRRASTAALAPGQEEWDELLVAARDISFGKELSLGREQYSGPEAQDTSQVARRSGTQFVISA